MQSLTDELTIPLLSNKTLARLREDIRTPTYDRTQLTPGILHIGVGNFHRAHQSWYLHKLMEMGLNHDWAILGAGIREFDRLQRDRLVSQDFLSSLIELSPTNRFVEVVGSMTGYIPIEPGNRALVAAIADPAIRIVSLTVTESGYYVAPATQAFDKNHPDITHDAANPETPVSVFGAIIAGARLRRDNGIGPFTIMSCDNLLGNGDVTKSTVLGLAKLSDPSLAEWIDANYTFPNSMVDCIVPSTSDADRAYIKSLGVVDEVPVTHENFRQWVIEDKFCAGRPSWEKVGVTFSDNVQGYEMQKIRILNAGHQILANIGELLNIDTVANAMTHPKLRAFFYRVLTEEIAPNISPVPGVTPLEYVDLITRRFENTAIVDTIRRIAYDGSARHPGMILPNIRQGLQRGTSVSGLSLVEAAWAHMCAGKRDDGSEIQPNDPHWQALSHAASGAKSDAMLWLRQSHIYGDLCENSYFKTWFSHWLQVLNSEGTVAALSMYLDSGSSRNG